MIIECVFNNFGYLSRKTMKYYYIYTKISTKMVNMIKIRYTNKEAKVKRQYGF